MASVIAVLIAKELGYKEIRWKWNFSRPGHS